MSQFYDPNTAVYLNRAVNRKVAVVTGGAGGLGWYTILHLYLHGYVVYMAARNPAKVNKAIADIKAEAKRRSPGPTGGELHFVEMDLTLLQLVKNAADTLANKETKIDILINNAGIMAVPYEITQDGYEIQYQVNFVSHMLLTLRLLPQLESSPSPRVVFVTLLGHYHSYRYFEPSDTLHYWPDALWSWVRYGVAKLADIQFTKYMAREHPRILWLSVHPGIVPGTDLAALWTQDPASGQFFTWLNLVIASIWGISNEQGSFSTLRAALDPHLLAEGDNGKFLTTGGAEGSVQWVANNPDNAKRTVEYNVAQLRANGYL